MPALKAGALDHSATSAAAGPEELWVRAFKLVGFGCRASQMGHRGIAEANQFDALAFDDFAD